MTSGQDSPKGMSQVDKQYLDKIRARLTRRRRVAEAAARGDFSENGDEEASMTASLPDDIDQMDDILFDRAPNNVNQVKLFGAWLDDALAGRKARKNLTPTDKAVSGSDQADASVQSHKKASVSAEEAVEHSSAIFAKGMTMFNKGFYRQSTALFSEAAGIVGHGSRLGGQYQLWHAQSLDAAGDKRNAASLLESLRMHADPDVRKVSRELHFIITAPALELAPGTFFEVPSIDDEPSPKSAAILTSNFGPLKTARVDKKPEPYSLEWYMEKERPPKVTDNSAMEAALITFAIFGTLAFMFTSS
ncbi:hypothetical protein BWQ96_01368 [Gracilariopsis chorda]|uniref:Uncharacterized protein n=1 Tax=Gracilariopsis chorda TaxID=448386 RepID=A0A2V3J3V9_9FLOR|nr:hypothetical protein BWQ96_01368 [Gracilariopsis chorda]|eukprot:PXF48812.1 hypothetical protein BWQ96_01368 [Gracilariopsis chorda]